MEDESITARDDTLRCLVVTRAATSRRVVIGVIVVIIDDDEDNKPRRTTRTRPPLVACMSLVPRAPWIPVVGAHAAVEDILFFNDANVYAVSSVSRQRVRRTVKSALHCDHSQTTRFMYLSVPQCTTHNVRRRHTTE